MSRPTVVSGGVGLDARGIRTEGGQLIAVPHLGAAGTARGRAVVNGVSVAVAPDSCPLMLVDVPLQSWGCDATLTLASAELVAASEGVLTFASEVPVTVVLGGARVRSRRRRTPHPSERRSRDWYSSCWRRRTPHACERQTATARCT